MYKVVAIYFCGAELYKYDTKKFIFCMLCSCKEWDMVVVIDMYDMYACMDHCYIISNIAVRSMASASLNRTHAHSCVAITYMYTIFIL